MLTPDDAIRAIEEMFDGDPRNPRGVDPALSEFALTLYERAPDAAIKRRIRNMAPRIVDTDQGQDLSIRRAFLFVDHAVRGWAPAALERAGFASYVARLRTLAPVMDALAASTANEVALRIEEEVRRQIRRPLWVQLSEAMPATDLPAFRAATATEMAAASTRYMVPHRTWAAVPEKAAGHAANAARVAAVWDSAIEALGLAIDLGTTNAPVRREQEAPHANP